MDAANVVKPGLDHLNSLLRPDYTSLNFDKFTKRGRLRLDKVIIPNIAVTFGPFGFASALLSANMAVQWIVCSSILSKINENLYPRGR